MPAVRPSLNAFNAGELTPLLDGRVDQDKYFVGGRYVRNFLPTSQGPVRRRGGTRHVGVAKFTTAKAWLVDFVFSADQAYILEFGNGYIRFWTNRGQLLSGGVPYEVVTPYSFEGLVTPEGTFALRTQQTGDVMWITHVTGAYAPMRLSRLGATNWTLVDETTNITNGPFKPVNADKAAARLTASATTGTITLTSTQPIFLSGHVGGFFYLEDENPQSVAPFQTYQNVTAGQQIRNGGNVYLALDNFTYVSGDQTQRYVPTHTDGEAFDGAVHWQYLHSGYGHVRIIAVAGDGLTATAVVMTQLPDGVITNGLQTRYTYRWAFGEFSNANGWPTGVTFYKERLTYYRGRQLFLSVNGDYANFASKEAGSVTAETAISVTLAADKLDSIRWAVGARGLLLGSTRAEMTYQPQTEQQVLSATNQQSVPQTEYGARMLAPLRVGEDILFVERAGHRIRAARYSFEIDRYKAEDVTVLSEHLFDGSELPGDPAGLGRTVIDWTYQQQRDSIVWCVMSDGTLNCLVYNKERGVVAWALCNLGGTAVVESVRSIPSPDGNSDDLWLVVRRLVNGNWQYSVEYMTDYRLVKQGVGEAVHVDNSTTYRGAAVSTITGLGYLEGETVSICVDGSNHPDRVVTGGQVTLDRAGSLVHVGYRFVSRLQTMRLEMAGNGGTSQSQVKQTGRVFLRLQSTTGLRFGPSFDNMDEMVTLDTSLAVGTAPALFTGDYECNWPGNTDKNAYFCVEQDKPLPATVVAIFPRTTIND